MEEDRSAFKIVTGKPRTPKTKFNLNRKLLHEAEEFMLLESKIILGRNKENTKMVHIFTFF